MKDHSEYYAHREKVYMHGKINTNIGNSATTSSIDEEVDKAVWSCRWGILHHVRPELLRDASFQGY